MLLMQLFEDAARVGVHWCYPGVTPVQSLESALGEVLDPLHNFAGLMPAQS